MTTTQTRNITSPGLHPAYSPTAQSFSSWLTRSQSSQLLPSFIAKRNRSNAQTELNIRPDQLCPSKVNEESCWTVIADRQLHTQLCDRVATLLKSSSDHLYKRERRVLSTYFELYLVGPGESEARPTMVISCTSKDDYKRVKGLIKKHSVLMDFPSVNLAATIGSPKSSRALEPLAAGDENGAATVGLTRTGDHDRKEAAQSGDNIYVTLTDRFRAELCVPQTIYIGRDETHFHKAVLGGFLKFEKSEKVYGLTVAHASDNYGAKTSEHEIQDPFDKAGGSPAKSNGISSLPAPSGPPGQVTNESGLKTFLGAITKTSQRTPDNDLDWALVDITYDFDLFQSSSAPKTIAPIPAEPKLIKLLRPEGEVRGTLSPSPTYIRVHDGANFVPAWAITVDGTINRGDCGSWVVDELTRSLYGHVAYGHPHDKVAYILPAEDMFAQIKEAHDSTPTLDLEALSEPILRNQERTRRRERQAERRPESSYRDRERSPAKIYGRPDPAPYTDSDIDTRRSRPRTQKRRSRLLDRMRLSRKARRKRERLGTILKAAGTCFFLSVLLSFLIALHFGLALFAQYVTDNKMDELRDFLMDMVMQCFQLLIRETLATENSESLQEYYKDQMTRLRDIRPPGERITRLKKAFESDAERKDRAIANAQPDPQKSPKLNVKTNGLTPQALTASKETPKPEKKWRKMWNSMKGKNSSPPKPTEPEASQPQPPAPAAMTETDHIIPSPEELVLKREPYFSDAENDEYYYSRRAALRHRSRSRSHDRSRPRLEPRRRYSERSRSRSRSRDPDRRRRRRKRSPRDSSRVSSNMQRLIKFGTQGYVIGKMMKEQVEGRDKENEKNVRFEQDRDRESDSDGYYHSSNPLSPLSGTSTSGKPESPREIPARRETDDLVIEEIFTDDEDVKGRVGDEEVKDGEKEEKRGDNVRRRSRTYLEGDDLIFDEFAPDGVGDEDGAVKVVGEGEGEKIMQPGSQEETRPRVDSGGSGEGEGEKIMPPRSQEETRPRVDSGGSGVEEGK